MIRLASVILILCVLGCDKPIAPVTPRELYFRGDHVKALGISGVIKDKRYDGKTWTYNFLYVGPSGKITEDWIPESAVGELIAPSPNRPQAERK